MLSTKVKIIVLCLVVSLCVQQLSFAQSHEGKVKVTITEEIDGQTNTSILTFANQASADRKLKEMGYSEEDFQKNSQEVLKSRKLTISMESSGHTDIETGEIRFDKLFNVPENATIEDLPDGGKRVTWVEVDVEGNIHTRSAIFTTGTQSVVE